MILLSWLLVFYNHLFQVKGQKMYNRQGPNKKTAKAKREIANGKKMERIIIRLTLPVPIRDKERKLS